MQVTNRTNRTLRRSRTVKSDSIRQTLYDGKKESGAQRRKRLGQKQSATNRGAWRFRMFDRPFIAWDGEGYTDETGAHHYMMLVASTGDYLLAPKGRSVSTRECFELFLRVATKNPKCNHVIFGGGYDFNMILGNLSKTECERLHQTGFTFYGPYKIEHRRRKSVSIHNRDTGEHVILYDVWGFFQTSFVKTLDAWGVVDDSLAQIVGGKAQRAQFEYENHKEILSYCRAELKALVTLMETFRDGLKEAGIITNRWDGPGAVAGALFTKNGTKAHKCDMEEWVPVNKAAQRAYFGGRIETVRFGNHEGDTFYYDINSAYPYAISQLPSLAGGSWRKTKSHAPVVEPMSLYHVAWDFTGLPLQPFYPLPFRRADGSIAFFPRGQGWFHSPEYQLLLDYFPDGFELLKSYVFKPATVEKPFAWVAEMYDLRRQWKSQERGEEKILKLGMNSLYGKMVQQLGWRKDRGIPPYHQLEWGGYVTSQCRAMLYRLALSNPAAVVGFETDGLITTERAEGIEPNRSLGGWGATEYQGVTYVQPGVYWLLDNGTWQAKYRGFDAGTLTRSAVLDGWENGKTHVTALSTRFVGMGLALQEDWRLWRRWETRERELSLYPSNPKRIHPPGKRGCDGICRPVNGAGSRTPVPPPSRQLHATALQWDDPGYWTGAESEPYPLQWRPQGRYTFADLIADQEHDLYLEEL